MRPAPANGYTLIELLVVIGILALLAAIATPMASHLIQTATLRSDTSRLLAGLRQVQDRAIRDQQTISVETSNAGLKISDGASIDLSKSTIAQITTPLIYYPDGTASGGTILLHNGDEKSDVSISWLTGVPRIEGTR
jgi:general secretion pathway protein H